MVRFGCTVAFLFVLVAGQAQNNFRSAQTGDWNQSSTWEEFVAGSWQSTSNTPDLTSGTITIQSPHVVTVTANVSIDQASISIGGTLAINDAVNLTLNNGSGTDLTVNGTIQVFGEGFVSGTGSFTLFGTLSLGSLNAAGAIVSGTTEGNIRNSGLRTYSSGAHALYAGSAAQFIGSGHPDDTGVNAEIDNNNGVTFDQNTSGNTSSARMTIAGNLTLTNGNLNVISTVGTGRTLALGGLVIDNGNFITVAGPLTNLLIEGSGDISAFPFLAGTQGLGQITINRPANTITFNNSLVIATRLTVSGNAVFNSSVIVRDVFLTSGTLDFNSPIVITGSVSLGNGTTLFFDNTSLSMAINYTSTGLLSCSGTSTLTLTGTQDLTSPLNFTPGSSMQTLSINKNSPGTSVTIGSPVTVSSSVVLAAGVMSNLGGSLTMASNSSITKSSSATLATSSPSGGPWSVTYTGGSQSTGLEIPATGSLVNLTVSTNVNTTVTLTQSVSTSGVLTVSSNSLILACGTNNVTAGSIQNNGTLSAPGSGASTGLTVNGNFVNNSTYTHNNGTLIIGGASVMSGTSISTTNFNSIVISGSGSLTAPATLNIAGDLTNSGAFIAGAGKVIFNGTSSSLLGTNMPATTFKDVTINAGATVTQASNFLVSGNLIVNGSLVTGSNTTTFSGTTALSGTGIGATVFNHVVINPASTLTAPTTTLRVGGNFTNDGTFTPGTSTVLFVGSSLLLGANINTTTFNNITVNGGASVTAPATLSLQGSLANNGTFTAGTGAVAFTGTGGAKTLSGTTNTQFFNLTMNKTNSGVSVSVTSAQTVTGTLSLTDGILDVGAGNLTLASASTIVRTSLATISATPAGGPWNLVYQGASVTTSVEIPGAGNLLSLTIDVDITRNVTLSQSITVQNAITINNTGRTLTCGTRDVTAGSIVNGGTFSAPGSASVNGLIVSGNFSNNGTYTHNNGLITFNGTSTVSGSTSPTFNRLTITGTLTGGVNFSVAGHFTNNGTFNAGTSLITFNGSALQNITGSTPLTTFRSLRITNTVLVSVQANVNLIDSLSLAANAKIDADGSANTAIFTLLSTSDAPAVDAKICQLPAGALVQGSVTVQRFFRPADNFDRFFSSPVTNATVAMVQAATPAQSFPVTGSFPGTSYPCTGCNNNGPNFRYYTESVTGIINKGYTSFITSTSSTLVPGVGYDAFMWNGVFNTTLSLRGPINTGTIALGIVATPVANSLTHTNNGVPAADGWNLVGNPYPSPIQWNNGAGWTKSNIDPTVWVWDVVGRVWHSYNANTSTGDLTNGVITSGQGFWVYAPAVGAASLSVNEQAKAFGISGTGSYFRTASAGEDRRESKALRISMTKGESTDNSFILIDPQASIGFDAGLDAPKLQLGIERVSIAMISEGRNWGHLALGNELPEVLPLSVYAEDAGPTQISFEVPDRFAALAGYYLVDSYLSRSVLVGSGQPYSFDIIAGDPSSQGDRFYLSKYPLVEKNILSTLRLAAHPNPAVDILHIQLSTEQVSEMALLDYAGRPVIRIKPVMEDGMSHANIDVSQQPTGLYVLKVIADGTLMTQKIVISH